MESRERNIYPEKLLGWMKQLQALLRLKNPDASNELSKEIDRMKSPSPKQGGKRKKKRKTRKKRRKKKKTRRKRKNTHLNLLDFPEAIEVEKLKEVHINKELISIFNRKKSKERILKILQNMFRRTQHITFYAVGNNCQQSFMKVTK